MEDRDFITYLIDLLGLLTGRKEGNGILPYEQSEEEENLEINTIKLLDNLLKKEIKTSNL
jgi:hypothetical protein